MLQIGNSSFHCSMWLRWYSCYGNSCDYFWKCSQYFESVLSWSIYRIHSILSTRKFLEYLCQKYSKGDTVINCSKYEIWLFLFFIVNFIEHMNVWFSRFSERVQTVYGDNSFEEAIYLHYMTCNHWCDSKC